MVDREEVPDGPIVAPYTWWSGGHGVHSLRGKMCERVLWIDDTPYAEFHDGWDSATNAPKILLIPVATLLREYEQDRQ